MNTLGAYKILASGTMNSNAMKYALLDFLENNQKIANGLLINIEDVLSKDLSSIVELIGIFHQKDKEGKSIAKTNERRHFGIFYTNYQLARFIVKETLKLKKLDLLQATFLEPCSGTGNFVIAYIDEVLSRQKKVSKPIVQKVINNIYCADIDSEAIALLKRIIPAYINKKYRINISVPEKNYYSGNLLFEVNANSISKNDPKDIFNISHGFDIVITNPPYKLLKENSDKYGGDEKSKIIKIITEYIRKEGLYPFNEGMLNYYKLFVEEIVNNYSNTEGLAGLLIPRTILNDKQAEKLRSLIFERYQTSTIYTMPENNNFFPEVSQAFCFFSVNKANKSENIAVVDNIVSEKDLSKPPINLSLRQLKEISSSIIVGPEISIQILKKLHKNPKLGSLTAIKNLRGELDLTFHKKYIRKESTPYKLIKGANLNEYSLGDSQEYVDTQFLNSVSSKNQFIKTTRIAGQQISNIQSTKRLKFAFVPANHILGNSCNFLALNTNEGLFSGPKISLSYLLGLMNSLLLDWRFKMSNSNNHVANYELNELPIVINGNKKFMTDLEKIATKLIYKNNLDLINKLNLITYKLYNLNKKEALYITEQYKNLKLLEYIKNNY